jgi:TFIIF-interacting CTD phosphatase-like protein
MSSDNDKPVIILDLDQTLISAEELGRKGVKKYQKKYPDKMKKFKHIQMEKDFLVFERPYLQDFLSYIFDNFRVSIWTAASQLYATFVIDKLILEGHPERKIDWIFFSYHCKISQKHKNGSKDLSTLWDIFNLPGYRADNTVILDDYDEVFNTQKDNCILAVPFEFTEDGSENDVFLKDLTKKLKTMVKERKDFKNVINSQ